MKKLYDFMQKSIKTFSDVLNYFQMAVPEALRRKQFGNTGMASYGKLTRYLLGVSSVRTKMKLSTSEHKVDGSPDRHQFRNRFLTEGESIFKHNAWDNFPWDDKKEAEAQEVINANSQNKFSESEREELEENAGKYWNDFYTNHHNKFFKDRQWLFIEFPELNVQKSTSSEKVKVLEIGCGVGNTIIPLLQSDLGKSLFIYGCDISENAINILKEHSLYDESLCKAFVCDLTCNEWTVPFEKNSLDIVTMIFVLSAISPDKHQHVITKIKEYLKPGGLILFRDYGRYDMAQLRFKNGRCISDNFYARGDGTRVYFFTQDDVKNMFLDQGFVEEQNLIDRRLQVNRSKLITMYRIWILAKYRKPSGQNPDIEYKPTQ